MTTAIPPFGLLLDVDGPIANPATRRLDIPSIATDLAEMAAQGVPIAFNTGRSLAFLTEQVIPALQSAGISAESRIYAVGEMGATWGVVGSDGLTDVTADPSVVLPVAFADAMRAAASERFSETMFFDETKQAMVSLEMRTDVTDEAYFRDQAELNELARHDLLALGLGVVWGEASWPNDHGGIDVRIEPTIISTDIMSSICGKAFGAERALSLVSDSGSVPTIWYTVGDSRHDYQMADWLYEQGYQPTHVDVRPKDGLLDRPFPVRTLGELIHDEACALLLSELAAALRESGS